MLGEVKAVRTSAIHEPAIAGDDGNGEVLQVNSSGKHQRQP